MIGCPGPAGDTPAAIDSHADSDTEAHEDPSAATTAVPSTTEASTTEATTSEITTGGEQPCPGFTSTPDSRFDALLGSLQTAVSPVVAHEKPSGLSVAIVVDGVLRHAGGVGTRAKSGHALADAPVGADTLFWIASTSKWIHGAMVSSLVEDGLLDFDAPVTAVLPNYAEANGRHDDITLHHLLTMTSGLAREAGSCHLFSVSESAEPNGCAAFSKGPETVLEGVFDPGTLLHQPYRMANETVYGAPGLAPFEYSNWGIMLSGRVAEVAGEAAHPDLVEARVFAPAQMCTATYDPGVVLASGDYAVGTGSSGGGCPEPELGHDSMAPWEPDELACRARDPNGGVRASAVDVGRFAAAFLADLRGAEVVMGEDAAHRMLCPGGGRVDDGCAGRVPTAGYAGSDTYGYTNFHQTIRGHDVYTHGGTRLGYGALLWIVPERDFAVVILANEIDVKDSWAEDAIACWLDGEC